MSGFSRIGKFVQVVADTETLGDAGRLRDRGLDIVVDEDAGASAPLMVRTATALALRCVGGPVRVQLPHRLSAGVAGATAIVEAAEAAAGAYDAADRIRVSGAFDASQLEVGLGTPVEGGAWAAAVGWRAIVNGKDPVGVAAAPAAVFAACCAVAKSFAAGVLGQPEHLRESWSLDLGMLSGTNGVPAELDLGRLALLGAGAIGNGVAFVLDASGWSADLSVIDCQAYEEVNHETSVLLSPAEARRGGRKAHVLASQVRRAGLTARGIDEQVDAASRVLTGPFGTFLCAVDNRETRQHLDGVAARCLLNAGVGGDRHDAGILVWSRHEPGDPVLSARYGRTGAPASTPQRPDRGPRDLDACSRIVYEDVSLAAPFMGLAAGALLVAGCVPEGHGRGVGTVRHVTFDLLKLQGAFRPLRRT